FSTELPDEAVLVVDLLALVDAATRGRVARRGDDGRVLAAVGIAGELAIGADHGAALEVELRAVGEGVLDRVAVEVLIDAVAAIVAAAAGLGFDRPCVLHPAAFVDVV